MERFKLNDPRKIHAARLQPKLARGRDISPKATENVADIMYQMLCDEKTLNVKDVVQAKYGPEMLDTIRNKEKAEFMAQTRSDLLLQVQADIDSTIKRDGEMDSLPVSGKSPVNLTSGISIRNASEKQSLQEIRMPNIAPKKLKVKRKFDIGNAFSQAMESSFESLDDDDTEEADNREEDERQKRVQYYELLHT